MLLADASAGYYIITHIRLSAALYQSGLLCCFGVDLVSVLATAYVFLQPRAGIFFVFLIGDAAQTITGLYPSAAWYEREILEFFGTNILFLADTRKLLLTYCSQQKPLRKIRRNRAVQQSKPATTVNA